MVEADLASVAYAQTQDDADPLRQFRDLFLIPSKADLARSTIVSDNDESPASNADPCTYLCGNSLGLQPTLTRKYYEEYLSVWAQKGVFGHFKPISDTHLPPWLHADDDVRADMATVVGAQESEVAVMQTLTANLHLMMCSFYRPTPTRNKILIEGKAFPSDHFAVESQIAFHGYSPKDSMVLLEPPVSATSPVPLISTAQILEAIDQHSSELALILLPGIQYYTGQFFDIATITAHARAKNITIGWDLAHAVGNVPLHLHDWDADFAVWCTYKYLNSGPGSIGGCFVHERHGHITTTNTSDSSDPQFSYHPRLSGWWGSAQSSRFVMANIFTPIPGAAGFQVSNASVADTTAVRASLDVFKRTTPAALREKSLRLTGYLESLLDGLAERQQGGAQFSIITPRDPKQRGAQLSLLLKPGLLESVMATLEAAGVVVDERRPDVIRVAPAPLYNSFEDVRRFVEVFERACEVPTESGNAGGKDATGSLGVDGGRGEKGWSEIK
ncbi:kynureninase [Dissoconium aciculare CBS 342.82]|uniref:Kynureninase n=1 Tax=Dissoconium aciculare CBS 342.82 TaxID=1314786 RepID=A0A6J3MF60_9PEZI|nr:kynureninase [Dissoconium aciculare CBS 342.82]KAF1826488.1 kynureninase [Dissoconium aciculare CBS 342.82]